MPIAKFVLAAAADTSRIVAGEAFTINVELYDAVSKSSVALNELVGASGVFPGTADAVVKVSGAGVAVDPTNSTRLQVTLSSSDTLALNQGDDQTWEVHAHFSDGRVRIAQLCESLDVVEALA
jgi:hypothetical protein